jgi:hypothetical protein
MPLMFELYADLVVGRAIYIADHYTQSLSSTAKRIMSFSRLPDGWDYGAGGPIPEHTLQLALTWENRLRRLGFLQINASPGGGGEVAIGAGLGDHYIEIIVEDDDTISVAYDFRGKQEFYYLRMIEADAHQILLELVGQIWSASTLYTQSNTSVLRTGGQGRPFGIIEDLYPLSDAIVSQQAELQYANTSETMIIDSSQLLSTSPRYFGSSIQIYYQPAAA